MGFEVYFRFFLAFAFTIGLIGVVYWVARRYAGRLGIVRAHAAGRLAITGQISLDTRRRLVLVQRDGCEHLLLLGPNNDLLIESGIGAAQDGFSAALKKAGTSAVPTIPEQTT
ncbi:flagellar biosynthetic protein FliO [Nisaea acidiphila]|uniref:Flagellar biosynthetic protein FliO n=1 Tax=Nisaea acidiphila TaxID=1862145 RepID=A0A9J7AUH4_9PROT|nr:flagellar biosynthetic protein FliO [Nisaea acidiphila]UUX50474.1 flagellar biosynthetic protein FliO [Nisaea acidiphila]